MDMRVITGFFIAILFVLLVAPESLKAADMPQPANESRYAESLEHLKNNEFAKVISIEERRVTEDPSDMLSHFLLAIAYLGDGKEKKASELARSLKEREPDSAAEVYAGMGRFFITKRRLHKALLYLNDSISIKRDPEVVKTVGSIYLSQGLLKKAREFYEMTLADSPDHVNLSRIYLAESEYARAIKHAELAIKEDGANAGGYLVLGTAKIITGELEDARRNFNILSELNPEFPLNGYFLGLVNLMSGRLEESLANFNMLKNAAPGLKETYLHTAVVWHLLGNLNKALEDAKKAVVSDPLDPAGHLSLANIYMSMGERAQAESEYQKSAELITDFGLPGVNTADYFEAGDKTKPAHFTLSVLYYRAGLYKQAALAAESASDSDGAEPFTRILKARSFVKDGERDAAEAEFAGLILKHPELITPYIELAAIYESERALDKSIELCEIASSKRPGNPALMVRLGSLYEAAGNSKKAISYYRRLVKAEPDSSLALRRLASALAAHGDLPGALEAALKGVSANPSDNEARETAGWIYFRLERYAEALSAYEAAVRNGSNDPMVFYRMGLVYQKIKNRDAAIESFEKALNLKDEFPESKHAKEVLKELNGLG